MSRHAFADESYREGLYLLTAALIDPGDLRRLRRLMRSLLLPRQRELHMKKEPPARRRQLLATVVGAGV